MLQGMKYKGIPIGTPTGESKQSAAQDCFAVAMPEFLMKSFPFAGAYVMKLIFDSNGFSFRACPRLHGPSETLSTLARCHWKVWSGREVIEVQRNNIVCCFM